MSPITQVYHGAAVFDGSKMRPGHVLGRDEAGRFHVLAAGDHAPETPRHDLGGGVVCPGFVDLQVNGGGGRMFNEAPDIETLAIMAEAHRALGCAAILPTLITDRPEVTTRAIAAVRAALEAGMPGIAGLHLEGPHLSVARKGAHDAACIRPMEAEDLQELLRAADQIEHLMVTIAPESVTCAQIREMAAAGITVSLGHTDADYDTAIAAFEAGARAVTHLFNAMSPLTSRAPGVVGAALAHGEVHAGLIADAIHVHPATIAAALRAKTGPGRIFLVSDAMATAGSDIASFALGGRTITRAQGRLTLEGGTLAGADLELGQAVRILTEQVGRDLEDALARATSGPAEVLGHPDLGRLEGADMALHLAEGASRPTVL